MKKIIDNFSIQSKIYSKYRPVYPKTLYTSILDLVQHKQNVWDCGTGNGQVAVVLADHFQQVEATDISENQLKNAQLKENINYSLQRAESTSFQADHFDLITVGQAIHWFDFEAFYSEARRVGKTNSVLVIFGYGLLRIEGINQEIDHFYTNIIGAYWNKERCYIDDAYATIPFPFEEIQDIPAFFIEDNWTLQQLEGYLNTWSSVQRFIKQEQFNPVSNFIAELKNKWPSGTKKAKFPVFVKMGLIE